MTDRELAASEEMERLEEEQGIKNQKQEDGEEVDQVEDNRSEEEPARDRKRVKDYVLTSALQPKKWTVEQVVEEFEVIKIEGDV
jgi:hypothetical protein